MGKSKNPYNGVRYKWSRKPEEIPHSTKKGNRGYNRKKFSKNINNEYIKELINDINDCQYTKMLNKNI